MQTIYLDISNKGIIPTIYAKQGDVRRKFLVVLTDAGIPYSPPAGSVFSVWYDGDSGEGNYTDIGEKTAFSINENKVEVELITQMLGVPGEGVLCLVLNGADGSQIASWNINYLVESVPGANSEQAKDYYTAFSRAVENLPYPDASLSVPGKAADAAAVGAALNGITPEKIGAAPAGYGLGEQGSTLTTSDKTKVDSFKSTGWAVYYNENNVLLVDGIANSHACLIRVEMFSGNFGRQTAHTITGVVLERTYFSGTWTPWDCVNPPMVLGVEYRTSERWNDKAVYTQVVNCGFAPNVSYKNIAFPYSVIRCLGFCDAGNGYSMSLPLIYGNSGTIVSCHHQSGNIIVYSNDNSSAYTVYVQVWYLKD
jgi:hypothetical protein